MKPSECILNLHVPSEHASRMLACVRCINRYCGSRQLHVVTVSPTKWYTNVAVNVSLHTHQTHELTDLLAGLYFMLGRCDMTNQDVNIYYR